MFFLPMTSHTLTQVTSTFDFVWPTAVALWNLRWQVKGFVEIFNGNVTEEDIKKRFIDGSKIHGANLRRATLETSWEYQKNKIAEILLINAFAIYESYIDEIFDFIQPTGIKNKDFQFSKISKELADLRIGLSTEDQAVEKAVYDKLSHNKKYSISYLDDLMKCYRYFKEIRNSIVHSSGKATPNLIKSSDDYEKCKPNLLKMGLKEAPESFPVLDENADIQFSLRGVVGFYEIIQRIIITIDAEFSRSKFAYKILKNRLDKLNKIPYLSPMNMEQKIMATKKILTELAIPFDGRKLRDLCSHL